MAPYDKTRFDDLARQADKQIQTAEAHAENLRRLALNGRFAALERADNEKTMQELNVAVDELDALDWK